jgi:hypothetical protein
MIVFSGELGTPAHSARLEKQLQFGCFQKSFAFSFLGGLE